MIDDRNLRFYLKKDDTTYYAVVDGAVVETTEEKHLQYSPVNWDEFGIESARDLQFWGMYRDFSPDGYQFYGDGQKILRSLYYAKNFVAECILEVRELDRNDMQYKTVVIGDLDFSSPDDKRDSFGVAVTNRGIAATIDAKLDIPYEIPMTLDNALTMRVDGLKIYNSVSYNATGYYAGTLTTSPTGAISLSQISRATELGKGYMPENINFVQQPLVLRDYYVFRASTDDDVTIQLKNMVLYSLLGAVFYVWKFEATSTVTTIYSLPISAGSTVTVNEAFTIPMQPDDRIVIWFQGTGASDTDANIFSITSVDEFNLAVVDVEGVIQFAQTTNKAYRLIDYGKHIVNSLSDGSITFESEFLSSTDVSVARRTLQGDNSPRHTVISSGDGVRGLPNAVIKGTFNQFLKFCWFRYGLGLGMEDGVLKLEPLAHWLAKDNNLGNIESVNDMSISTWKEKTYNMIEIGYNDVNTDVLSGKDAFNVGYTYSVRDNEKIVATDDVKTDYIADPFAWEFLRNQLSIQGTQNSANQTRDSKYDNDIFVAEIDIFPVSGAYPLYRPTTYVSGFNQADNIYNVSLEPIRALVTGHLSRYRSMLSQGWIDYQTTDRSRDLVTQITVPYISRLSLNLESDVYGNPIIGEIPIPLLYKNFIFTGEIVLDKSLDYNGRGYFTYFDKNRGKEFKVFILSVVRKAGKNQPTQGVFLSHPENEFN